MKIRLKARQGKVFRCKQRFRILVAGRRFGKTYLALTELIRGAWGPGRIAWYVCPTYRQGKRVAFAWSHTIRGEREACDIGRRRR